MKGPKNACFADRPSCMSFWANRFRLLLHAAAYWLLDTLRRWLVSAGSARRQLDTLRLEVLKVGGRVYQWASRARLRSWPAVILGGHCGNSWLLVQGELMNNPG